MADRLFANIVTDRARRSGDVCYWSPKTPTYFIHKLSRALNRHLFGNSFFFFSEDEAAIAIINRTLSLERQRVFSYVLLLYSHEWRHSTIVVASTKYPWHKGHLRCLLTSVNLAFLTGYIGTLLTGVPVGTVAPSCCSSPSETSGKWWWWSPLDLVFLPVAVCGPVWPVADGCEDSLSFDALVASSRGSECARRGSLCEINDRNWQTQFVVTKF